MVSSVKIPPLLASFAHQAKTSILSNRWVVTLSAGVAAGMGLMLLFRRLAPQKAEHKALDPNLFCRQQHKLSINKPCLNDNMYLRFDGSYAQGILKIVRNILPHDKPIHISCLYKENDHQENLCFAYQHLPATNDSQEILIPNMPFQKEMTLEITTDNGETLFKKTFRVEQPLAVYRVERDCIRIEPLSKQPVKLHTFSFQESSNQPSRFILNGRHIEPSSGDNAHFTINNQNPCRMALTFEFRFNPTEFVDCFADNQVPWGYRKTLDKESHIALPFMVPPKETIELSKEFVIQSWRDAYIRSHNTRSVAVNLDHPELFLMSVQSTAYPT